MNIDDLLAKDEKEPKQDVAFDIAEVEIEDSAFSFRDEQKGAQYALSKVNLKTGRIANNVPTKVDLSRRRPGEPAEVESRDRAQDEADVRSRQAGLRAGRHERWRRKERRPTSATSSLKATGSVTAKPETNEFTAEKLAVAMTGTSGKDNLDVKLDAPKLVLTADKATGEKVARSREGDGSAERVERERQPAGRRGHAPRRSSRAR